MRQFWFFSEDDGNRPHYPDGVTPRRESRARSVRLLETTAAHAHLWIPGFARPDSRLAGAEALHFHDVIWYNGAWHQITTGAGAHEHGIPAAPSYWLVCALLQDADVSLCAADPRIYSIGEVVDGSLSTGTWDAGTIALWQTRMEAAMYLAMPDTVINPERFVVWVANVLGLHATNERAYRCPFGEGI
jgi:hypothetical protein